MILLASDCPEPGSLCCSHFIVAWECNHKWTLVHRRPAPSALRAIPRASQIAKSSVSKTSLFVPWYISCVFHPGSCKAMLASVRHVSKYEPPVQNNTSPRALMCCEAAFTVSSLLLSNRATLPLNDFSSTNLMCYMPDAVSIPVPSMTVWARYCHSVSCPLRGGPDLLSMPSGCSPCCAWSSPPLSVTGKMSLVVCDLGASSRRNPYLSSLLLSSVVSSLTPAFLTTIPEGADQNIPVISLPYLITSFW